METKKNTFSPDAVIFDMDGLMLDTERVIVPVWGRAGEILGYNISQDVILKMVGISSENARVVMLDEFGGDFPYDQLREKARGLYKKEFEENGIPHKKGLICLLDHLAAAKIPLAVATSTRKATALEMLRMAGIVERFTAIVGGDEVVNGKPAPDIFLLAAEKLGQPPSACIGFEDSPAGLKGLCAAGIRSVFIKDLIEPPREVLTTVWRRFDDLSEAVQLFV